MQARIVRKKKARARAARRRAALAKAQAERAAVYDMLAARMMAKHDPEGTGSISAEAVREAVNETVGSEVGDDVLRQLRSICELSSPEITKPMRTSDLQFLLQASRAYGLQAKRVTEVLQKHDVDKSGGLDFKELMNAMKEIAPKDSKVRAGDVSWIVEKYDLDGDGQLGFLELVPAVTAWQEVAQLLPPDPEDDDEEDDDEHQAITVGAEAEDSTASDESKADAMELIAKRAAARCHRLEGARVMKKGVIKTLVRTLSDTSMVVDNAELKECERTVQMMKQKSAKDAKKAAKEAGASSDGAAPAPAKKSSMCHVL